jgi:hypothetical protein
MIEPVTISSTRPFWRSSMAMTLIRTVSTSLIVASAAAILALGAPAYAHGSGGAGAAAAGGGMRGVSSGASPSAEASSHGAAPVRGTTSSTATTSRIPAGVHFGGGGAENIPPSTEEAIAFANQYLQNR